MANKHVLNPCANSGKQVSPEQMANSYNVKKNGVLKAFCPECGDAATVSKKYGTYRKHKAREQSTLFDVFTRMDYPAGTITGATDMVLHN